MRGHIDTIAIDLSGQNATNIDQSILVALDLPVKRVKSLKVVDYSQLTNFTYNGKTQAVLNLDDIKKVLFTFKNRFNKYLVDSLPASGLCQLVPKMYYTTDLEIDFSKSFCKIQAAISTPGWLVLEIEYFKTW